MKVSKIGERSEIDGGNRARDTSRGGERYDESIGGTTQREITTNEELSSTKGTLSNR